MSRKRRSWFSVVTGLVAFALALKRSMPPSAAISLRPQGASDEPNAPGRAADSPEQIPARGWWEISKRTAKKFSDNELMAEAASVTFFALLSIFPALTAIVSIYGLFADPSTMKDHLDAVGGFVPSGGMDIIRDQITSLAQSPAKGLSAGAAVGIVTALWSANQGSKAMLSALNDVYGERESRSFFVKTAISLAFTIGGVVCLLLALGAVVVLPLALKSIGLTVVSDNIFTVARWPVLLIGITIGLAILYRFGPSRASAKWRWVTPGGVIASLLWIGLSFGFSWYVEHFGSYNKTYGSLGAVVGFMTWIWLSGTALLLGAQVNAEMEMQTAQDTTTGPGQPAGVRGAAAADKTA